MYVRERVSVRAPEKEREIRMNSFSVLSLSLSLSLAPPLPLQETFLSAIGRIYREEGPSALMLGFTPRVFRAIFSGALQFSTYEFTKGKAGG
jgi:hypothetical protein